MLLFSVGILVICVTIARLPLIFISSDAQMVRSLVSRPISMTPSTGIDTFTVGFHRDRDVLYRGKFRLLLCNHQRRENRALQRSSFNGSIGKGRHLDERLDGS